MYEPDLQKTNLDTLEMHFPAKKTQQILERFLFNIIETNLDHSPNWSADCRCKE